jgi:D-serine deaminase-like pyridoxal phosphate-dependent protein
VALAQEIAAHPDLTLRGVQAYYGHLQHVPTYEKRREAIQVQTARIRALLAKLGSAGFAAEIVTGGGTGTFQIDIAERVFTELQAGSYPFFDREYYEVEYADDAVPAFEPALFVQATVVSAREPGLGVVNAGYKSFATEGGVALPWGADCPESATYELMGDEHGGVRFPPSGRGLEVGDKVEFLVPHCDPTINLYEHYHCVRGDVLVDIWPIDARGR